MRTLVCCGVLVSLVGGAAACARRAPAVTPMLAVPRPPDRDVPRTDEHRQSADDILGRVRDRLKNSAASPPPAPGAPAPATGGAQADAASEAAAAGWSVVVSPASTPESEGTAASSSIAAAAGDPGVRGG